MSQKKLELNTVLMKSTFKLLGKKSMGTTFIIGRPSEREQGFAHFVVVTAAHVLEEMEGSRATLFLRKKNKAYQKFSYPIEIRHDGKPLWIRHPDVDVAAMYVNLPSTVDIELLPTGMLANDETLKKFEMHPGDELMCLGYPLGAEATEAGFPVLRSGKIASYPLIPTKETKTFLYDFRIFRGNSGGPVYFVESGRIFAGTMHVGLVQFIAGLVSKEHIIKERIETLYETREEKHSLGLATVVHASFIRETINMLPPKS
ncbi:MAG: serine protease [Candidatus Bathyarchaeota archaeon]|nr:serine protease [Candidatus Bathyarchaeota archaeon]